MYFFVQTIADKPAIFLVRMLTYSRLGYTFDSLNVYIETTGAVTHLTKIWGTRVNGNFSSIASG